MNNNKKNTYRLNENTIQKQLLSVLGFILLFVLLGLFSDTHNTRRANNEIYYNQSQNCYFLQSENLSSRPLYFDNHWIFVPNITSEQIIDNEFSAKDYNNYPHAEGVTISSARGWNDLGDNAVWYNLEGEDIFKSTTSNNRNGVTAAYIINIHVNHPNYPFFINIPKVSGTTNVFCNDKLINTIHDASLDSNPIQYKTNMCQTDENGYARIVITVVTSDFLYAPGILAMPAFIKDSFNFIAMINSALWAGLLFSSLIFGLVGGGIVSTTFSRKSKYYLFILCAIMFMFYSVCDGDYYTWDSVIIDTIKIPIVLFMAVTGYCTVASFFLNQNEKTDRIIRHHIMSYVAVTILFVIILSLFPWLLKMPLIRFTTIGIVIVITVSGIIQALLFYMREKHATLAINTGITFLFTFLYMFKNVQNVYNIRTYTIFPVVALFILEGYFLRMYVRQFFELRESSNKLNRIVKEKTQHITEINRDLYKTNQKLLENEEARRNVLSNVSHDLRTPITAIRGYAELLLTSGKNMKSEQVDTYLNNIMKRSIQMERIVSDIMELTRMESNENEFKFNDISISELLDEVYMMYLPDVKGTNKKLTLDIPEDDLLIVSADYKKISRVFENLISNSINYTYEDALIEIKAWRSNSDKTLAEQRVHITIKDNGIGIPEEEIEKVFDRFYRAKNSGKNIKGTGLGLSIVKTVIDHHKGEISINSTIGQGTEFHISLKATF